MSALVITNVLLWIIVGLMGIAITALARQIGILHERLAPMGALSIKAGPEVGDVAPRLTANTLGGATVEVGNRLPVGRAALLLFISPTCPICKKLIPIAQRFGRSERLKVIFVGDGETSEQLAMAEKFQIDLAAFVNGPDIGMRFQVSKLPYAVLLDHEGVIAAKGLVNSREHLESLVVAHESGYDSIQSYLSANNITTLGG